MRHSVYRDKRTTAQSVVRRSDRAGHLMSVTADAAVGVLLTLPVGAEIRRLDLRCVESCSPSSKAGGGGSADRQLLT